MAASSNVRSVEEQMWEAVLLQALAEENKRLEEKNMLLEEMLRREELEAALEAKRKPKKSGWKIAKFILKLANEECKIVGDNLDKAACDMINPFTWKGLWMMGLIWAMGKDCFGSFQSIWKDVVKMGNLGADLGDMERALVVVFQRGLMA